VRTLPRGGPVREERAARLRSLSKVQADGRAMRAGDRDSAEDPPGLHGPDAVRRVHGAEVCLRMGLILTRRLPADPRLVKVEAFAPHRIGHYFDISRPDHKDSARSALAAVP